jgi:hypothetical protein
MAEMAEERERREHGARLRERVYVTFTALAVLMVTGGHSVSPDPRETLAVLVVTVVGVLLAGFTSDVVAHMLVRRQFPDRRELRHMSAVSVRALGAILFPCGFLALALAGWLPAFTSVWLSVVALLMALGVIMWIAVRRTDLAWGKRLLALTGVVGLGVVVVALEYLAH